MVKFGNYTLPHVLSIQQQQSRVFQEIPLPGRPFAYRKDRGGLGSRFTVQGEIRPTTQLARDQISALADGTARILDLEKADLTVLESCLRYQTGPTWTDNTIEAASAGGTPFTLLGAASDYHYFGHREKFNQLQFSLQTLGSYGLVLWEYSKGAGAWGNWSTQYDDFPGSSLDSTKWTSSGSVTLTGGWVKIDNWSWINSVLTFAASNIRHDFRVKVESGGTDYIIYAFYVDANNYIQAHLVWNGPLELITCSGGNTTTVSAGSWAPSNTPFTLTFLKTPTSVRMYKDGVLVATSATNIPLGIGKMKLGCDAGGGGGPLDIDYINYSSTDPCVASDGTNMFSQAGTVSFSSPSDWKQDTVNAVASKFWLRISVPAITTAATVNQIQLNNIYNCVMLDPQFNETADNYNALPYTAIFAQVENP